MKSCAMSTAHLCSDGLPSLHKSFSSAIVATATIPYRFYRTCIYTYTQYMYISLCLLHKQRHICLLHKHIYVCIRSIHTYVYTQYTHISWSIDQDIYRFYRTCIYTYTQYMYISLCLLHKQRHIRYRSYMVLQAADLYLPIAQDFMSCAYSRAKALV